MHKILLYENHLGKKFILGKENTTVTDTDILNFEWTYSALNEKIASFSMAIKTSSIEVIVAGENVKDIVNELTEIMEADILSNMPGKLYIVDFDAELTTSLSDYYYLTGYFNLSEKTEIYNGHYVRLKLAFVSDQKHWVKEKSYQFRYKDEEESTGFLDYPYDYPYDYFVGGNANNLNNESGIASDFLLTIYGKSGLTSINIAIGGQTYLLNTSASDNEYIQIDSRDKTITKTGAGGAITNLFNYRSRTYNIFQKIASGQNSVTWDDDFDFDITLYEERSEPLWT